jgi:surface polysaccharide O-acyltransferase-like enzyme
MLMIVLHHFITHGLQIAGYDMYDTAPTNAGILANSFFIIGVNVFILISGYFGIKQSWKGFWRLFAFCFFYQFLFTFLLSEYSFLSVLKRCLRLFSHSQYWFIQDYFLLWLIAPILNFTIDKLKNNKKKFVFLLLTASVFAFYFEWFYNAKYSGGGYNLWNFMFLYFIGRFIALHTKEIRTLKPKSICLSIYLFMSVLTALLLIQKEIGTIWLHNKMFNYNSPLVIISAIAFFLFFRNLNIKSKAVNWLASSALAVYLITESIFVGGKYLYPFVQKLGENIENGWLLAFYLFLLAVGVVIGCLLIDKVRMLINNPIEKLLAKIPVEKQIRKGVVKISNLIK